MLIYKSRFLTRGEVWFDDEADGTPVDWIYYRQRPSPVAKTRWKYFYTLLIDLAKSPDQLMGEMDEKTVQKIKEAEEKDQTSWKRCEPKESNILDDVERMWNQFAAAQKSPPLDRAWLDRIIEAGALELSAATDPAGKGLPYQLCSARKKWRRELSVVSPANFI